jgi:protein O-GlcNAc transferase
MAPRPANKTVIVFYCEEYGQTWWPQWGPWSLTKGVGGSEDAVISLAFQLALLPDVHVEVYLDPPAEHIGTVRGVGWYPGVCIVVCVDVSHT